MRIVILIPARFKSTRFPGKPLANINGRPMILRVADICAEVLPIEDIYIATDSEVIAEKVSQAGYNYLMTSENALTGTDRISEAIKYIDAEIFINVQGDEPLVSPNDIRKVIEAKKLNYGTVIKGYSEITREDPRNLNIPKVVMNDNHRMVYMSRSLIPGSKVDDKARIYNKAVCIYGFNREELESFGSYGGKSNLEEVEDIEILRFLDIGIDVRMVKLEGGTIAVDHESDIEKVEKILNEKKKS